MFDSKRRSEREERLANEITNLESQIAELTSQVRSLVRERNDLQDVVALNEEITELQRKIVDLEIVASKKQEEFDKEKREVEHYVGLERRKSEFERESSKREAELKVREQNLGEERKLFEAKMTSVTKNLEERIEYLQNTLVSELMKAVTNAMPTVDLAFGSNGRKSRAKEKEEASV